MFIGIEFSVLRGKPGERSKVVSQSKAEKLFLPLSLWEEVEEGRGGGVDWGGSGVARPAAPPPPARPARPAAPPAPRVGSPARPGRGRWSAPPAHHTTAEWGSLTGEPLSRGAECSQLSLTSI